VLNDEIQFAREIKAGKLELICPEMDLLVCPSYEDVALKGMGVIRSNDLGRLYFRMISPPSGHRHPSLVLSKLAGENPDPTDYVMLRAIDEVGREWRSNWLIINIGNQIPLPNYSVSHSIGTISHSHERKALEHSKVRIVVPNAPTVPFDAITKTSKSTAEREIGWSSTVDHHVHRVGESEVTFRGEDGGFLSIEANMKGAFGPTWAGFMCHSLGFAAAETIRPAVVVREFSDREDFELRSGPFLRYASRMPRPIHFRGLEGARDFWRLVEHFLKYVSEELSGSKQDQLLEELEGIRRGSQGSFQTACLTLAVGVESICKLLLGGQTTESACTNIVTELLKYLDKWPGDSGVKNRAQGMLSGLTAVRASDLMYAWARETGNATTLVDSWKKLRNPKAHGATVDEDEGQVFYYSVVELLHRVIATAIRYEGPITRTSQRGWGLDSPS